MNKERGSLDYVVIGVCVLLMLLAVGFFQSDKGFFGKFNYKAVLNLPTGITLTKLDENTKITFPYTVKGYINGGGWERGNSSAGIAQIFDSKGIPVTKATALSFADDGTDLPSAFIAILTASGAPTSGTGMIVFTSTTGLVHTVPIRF